MKKVIIDCDPGIDDALALMLALSSPEIEVIGITIVSGNVPVEIGSKNVYRVLKILKKDIPIYIGDNEVLKGELVTAQDTHGIDGLGEVYKEKIIVPEEKIKKGAVEFIIETLKKEKDISIIALGPLTNLAKVVLKEKHLLEKCKRIVSMGGAYRTNGNCSQIAEYNYWVDPKAVNIVFNSTKKIELIPLDVTRKIVLTPNIREYLNHIKDEKARFIYEITKFYVDFHWKQERILGCVINDPLAVAYFIDSSICKGFFSNLECVEEGIAKGGTLIDIGNFYKRETNVYLNDKVDRRKFLKLFFVTIFPQRKDEIEKIMEEN